jgi:hypothetical protein
MHEAARTWGGSDRSALHCRCGSGTGRNAAPITCRQAGGRTVTAHLGRWTTTHRRRHRARRCAGGGCHGCREGTGRASAVRNLLEVRHDRTRQRCGICHRHGEEGLLGQYRTEDVSASGGCGTEAACTFSTTNPHPDLVACAYARNSFQHSLWRDCASFRSERGVTISDSRSERPGARGKTRFLGRSGSTGVATQ